MSDDVLYEERDDIAIIAINRPDKLNTLTDSVIQGIADGIEKKARTHADETRQKAAQDIDIEAQKAQIELRDDVVSMAIGAAEKVIGERLDDDLHRKLITEYIAGLKPDTPDGGASDA